MADLPLPHLPAEIDVTTGSIEKDRLEKLIARRRLMSADQKQRRNQTSLNQATSMARRKCDGCGRSGVAPFGGGNCRYCGAWTNFKRPV